MGQRSRPASQSTYLRRLRHEMWDSLVFGGILTCIYCVFVVGIFIVRGSSSFDRYGTSFSSVLAAYTAAGLGAGLLVGLLHPLKRGLVGPFILGLLVAYFVMIPMHIAMYGMPARWDSEQWGSVIVLGTIFGIAGAFIFRKA